MAQPLADAYEYLFADSVQRYNARQKRNDRKIRGTYYESLFHQEPSNTVVTAADKRKSFYEDVVQIGKMEDSGIGTEDAQLVAECLKEYMIGFQERNPNFYVFNAILHMDEATPHLHIDYIPIAHHKRGMDTQNGIAKALEEMGYGTGKMAIARWRASEVEILNKICREHGIEPLPPEKSRGTIKCEEYREQRRKAEQLAEENEKVTTVLSETREELDKAVKKKTKLVEIDSIETGKTVFGGKVTMSKEDYDNLTALAKKQVASEKQTKKLKSENAQLREENDALKQEVQGLSAELAEYKKHAMFSREKLKKEHQRITKEDELSRKLKRAMLVIDRHGLRGEFEQTRLSQAKGYELE